MVHILFQNVISSRALKKPTPLWRPNSAKPRRYFFVDFAIKEVNGMEATGDGAARTTQSYPTEMKPGGSYVGGEGATGLF